jgi:hypothetical protein
VILYKVVRVLGKTAAKYHLIIFPKGGQKLGKKIYLNLVHYVLGRTAKQDGTGVNLGLVLCADKGKVPGENKIKIQKTPKT